MIKHITETIPETKSYLGVVTPEHEVVYSYDTENIKSFCIDCFMPIRGNLEENYIKRGNYCYTCNNLRYYPNQNDNYLTEK